MKIKVYRLYINPEIHPAIYDRLEHISKALRGDFIRDAIEHFMASNPYPGKAVEIQPSRSVTISRNTLLGSLGRRTDPSTEE